MNEIVVTEELDRLTYFFVCFFVFLNRCCFDKNEKKQTSTMTETNN